MNTYRPLTADEVSALQSNGCTASNWNQIEVEDPFCPDLVQWCTFSGTVHLGQMTSAIVTDGTLQLPVGLYGSTLCNCTVGRQTAVHRVAYLSGYQIGDGCLLFDIGEMTCDDRYEWLSPMNENGERRILPFGGMLIADAYLWARYRDRSRLMDTLEQMTRAELARNGYGTVGDKAVVKHCREIHNVALLSSSDAPTRARGCVVLSDGVVGYGCCLDEGVMARRFLLGENVHLEFGARVNDSVVGDNSTIARCEVGCSLIFPSHEQHHNNSFLIASLVMGQSNVAAGATIGSNHNGRTADGELVAGRGFWPGLCSSFKHSSRFASYCLLSKGSYPSELDISLPFALVSNNESKGRLEVMPAYWWMYNMYALNRNGKKFAARDRRCYRRQHIVYAPLSPDTAEEIMCGRALLRHWTEQAYMASVGNDSAIEVRADGMERGRRHVVVIKAAQGYAAYEEMLVYYAMGVLTDGTASGDATLPDPTLSASSRCVDWVNMGGQLMPADAVDQLIHDIEEGAIGSWQAVHDRYDQLWKQYPMLQRQHAYQLLCHLTGVRTLDEKRWQELLSRYRQLCLKVEEQIRVSREKDIHNPFRRMTYRNDAEMQQVLK